MVEGKYAGCAPFPSTTAFSGGPPPHLPMGRNRIGPLLAASLRARRRSLAQCLELLGHLVPPRLEAHFLVPLHRLGIPMPCRRCAARPLPLVVKAPDRGPERRLRYPDGRIGLFRTHLLTRP